MKVREIQALTGALAPVIRDYVVEGLQPILERLEAVEKHVAEKGLEFSGTHQRGAEYRRGQAVVAGGSLWIATTTTTAAPGNTGDWALAAKAGRDGRDLR